MALNSPVLFDDFFALLPPATQVRFRPHQEVQVGGLRGGDLLSADLSPQYWGGQVTLPPMRRGAADQLAALFDDVAVPGVFFEAVDLRRWGPQLDPAGAVFGSSAPVITHIDRGENAIRFEFVPPNYALRRGDLLSIHYSGGAGRSLHRIRADISAGGAGVTQWGYLTVPLALGVAPGDLVSLVRPSCFAKILPASISYGESVAGFDVPASFEFRQVFKG